MKGSSVNFDSACYDRSLALWKGIMKHAPNLKLTMSWSIGNGSLVSFWTQNWVDGLDCRINFATTQLDNSVLSRMFLLM